MTGPLLRTGSLKAFHPLGAVGNPVYLAASQLRAAISRRLGAEVADTFAIPQRNEDGDTIDWYAARPGPVVPWSAATADERARAQERLLDARARIEALAGAMQQESDGERQVFGRLLEHVTRFPDDEHVYLVNDVPVVTFWGFLLNDAAVGSDPLLKLDLLDEQTIDPAPDASLKRRVPWWPWLLLLLLLIPLLLFLLRACQEQAPPDENSADGTAAPVTEGQSPVDEVPVPLSDEQPVEAPLDEPLFPRPEQPQELVDDRGARRIEIERRSVAIEADDSVTRPRDGETRVSSEQTGAEEAIVEEAVVEEAVVEEGAPAEGMEGGVEEASVEPVEEQTVGETIAVDEEAASGEAAEEAALPATGEEPGADGEPAETEPPVVSEVEDQKLESMPETETPQVSESGEGQGEEAAPEVPQQEQQDQTGPADPGQPATAEADPNSADPGAGAEPTSRPGDSLSIPPTASGARSVRFLNGGWRTATSLQDPKTGLPINLEYQLKDGAGKVRLKRHDGSTCEGAVKTGLDGGNLVIDSTGNIVCADGTNFGRPKLVCKPGADGKADCQGRYPGGETFSVDINKRDR